MCRCVSRGVVVVVGGVDGLVAILSLQLIIMRPVAIYTTRLCVLGWSTFDLNNLQESICHFLQYYFLS